MKRFAELYGELDRTTRTSEKVEALKRYFVEAAPRDAIWVVYLISGRKMGRTLPTKFLREWVCEVTGFEGWLVDECYLAVGDLSETLSLLLPEPSEVGVEISLHVVIEEYLQRLPLMSAGEQKRMVMELWGRLPGEQRFILHKLVSGNFRMGASGILMMRALAEVAGVAPAVMAHRLSGNWKPTEETMVRLLKTAGGEEGEVAHDPNVPYPFMLAHALTDPLDELGEIGEWLVEPKWDGIRAQLLRREGGTLLWSRGDELVSEAFPEIVQAAGVIPVGTVLDGEILAWVPGSERPMTFAMLQRRINRKGVEMSFWPEVPVTFMGFDVLEFEGRDVRGESLAKRREMLAHLKLDNAFPEIRRSVPVVSETWEGLHEVVAGSRERSVEGLMLKKLASGYLAGRPTGEWWKLKIQPYSVDAVLIAAQPGHGRRAGLLTDYTFGVWDGGKLVPVAKAYSGLTDKELEEVDRFARAHSTERFGPVYGVEAKRVFEIGFEAIAASDRHKSGVALRFPRILRIRDDKKVEEADTLESLQKLLAQVEARR